MKNIFLSLSNKATSLGLHVGIKEDWWCN